MKNEILKILPKDFIVSSKGMGQSRLMRMKTLI